MKMKVNKTQRFMQLWSGFGWIIFVLGRW